MAILERKTDSGGTDFIDVSWEEAQSIIGKPLGPKQIVFEESEAKTWKEAGESVQKEMMDAMVANEDMDIICQSNTAFEFMKRVIKGLPKAYKGKVRIKRDKQHFVMHELRGVNFGNR